MPAPSGVRRTEARPPPNWSRSGSNRTCGFVFVQERLCRRAAHQSPQFAGVRHHQQPKSSSRPRSCLMCLPGDRREERACIVSPAAVLSLMIGNEGSSELLDVVGVLDLREQVPLHRAGSKGLSTTSPRSAGRTAACSRRPDPRSQRDRRAPGRRRDFLNRRTLAGARGADQLEVLGLVLSRHRGAGQGEAGFCSRMNSAVWAPGPLDESASR